MAIPSPPRIPHQIPHYLSPRLHTLHFRTPLIARRHHRPASHTPRGGVKPPNTLWKGRIYVVNGLALTCKFHVRHSWEGPETTTGAYGTCCKPAHTVHAVHNFNLYVVYLLAFLVVCLCISSFVCLFMCLLVFGLTFLCLTLRGDTARRPPAAQRRGPGEGCARRPVGTYLYLHAVGVGNLLAVPGLAR
jgi:hypothetical protein